MAGYVELEYTQALDSAASETQGVLGEMTSEGTPQYNLLRSQNKGFANVTELMATAKCNWNWCQGQSQAINVVPNSSQRTSKV